MSGKQLRLFLVDGTPGGLITAEIMNWTGHVIKGGRDKLAEIKGRAEAGRPGVYFLIGEDDAGQRVAYIGMADDVARRLSSPDHPVNKRADFWQDIVVVTSKDANLTSAHVRYLESSFIRLAQQIGRVPLLNGNVPSGGPDLPEADRSDMDDFIGFVRIVLPVLGVDVVRGRKTVTTTSTVSKPTYPGASSQFDVAAVAGATSPEFRLQVRKDCAHLGIKATAQVIDGEFTVLTGSLVVSRMLDPTEKSKSGTWAAATKRQYASRMQQHQELVANGAISLMDEPVSPLTRDVVFSSPSAAACVVQGVGSVNGRIAWVGADGQTYGQWEDG